MIRNGNRVCLLLAVWCLPAVLFADEIPIAIAPKQAPSVDTRYRQGMATMQKGDLPGASAIFQEILKADPRNVSALLGATDVAIQQGNKAEATSNLRRATEAAPNDASIYRGWARFYVGQREYTEANTALEKAIRMAPKDPYALIDLGDLQVMGFRDLSRAVETYKKALALDPTNSGAQYALGVAFGDMGKLAEAQGALRVAIRLAPSNPRPYMALGRVLVAANDAPGSLAAYAGALSVQPDLVGAYLGRGDVYAAQNNDANALAEYAKALKADPKNADAYLRSGILYQKAGKFREASEAYLKATELNPRLGLAYNNLAWMAAQKQTADLAKAEMWAKKAVESAPGQVVFQDTLAWVYRANGQPDKARELLVGAMKKNPGLSDLNYHLGVILQESGKGREALAYLKKAQADRTYAQAADVQTRITQIEKP